MFDDFYGFSARPFQLTPDPAFWFESVTHRQALSYLGYGLAQGEGFITITGEVGAGKSTLVAHLMATIDRQRLTAAQIVTSRLSDADLVQLVAQAFAISQEGEEALGRDPGQGKARALSQIEAFLHAEARAGRRCLLVVDECQNLTIEALEELRMLSNFQLGAHPLLQILMLGQPEFRERLQGHPDLEQLRQRVIAAHHLEAMGADELDPYLVHRLKLVGWTGQPSFTPDLLVELYRVTGGVPRRVNQVVNRLLMLGAAQKADAIDEAMLAVVMAEMTGQALPAVMTPQADTPVAEEAGEAKPASVLHEELTSRLAEQAAQIAELQQAVIELANGHEAAPEQDHLAGVAADLAASQTAELAADRAANKSEFAALQERIAAIEARLAEQDRTLRHTLTMLIEWIEKDGSTRVAA
ncbi:MAG: AAA family ATPase [Sphingomonadales bacterium]|nr:AAA family ATPase [Sphingomonadales bacterium]MDE2169926.1 AAA family ATPase [Sphingomonadales bacterium]